MYQELIALAVRVFGINLPTSLNELKKAYREEAKKCHPDKGGSEEDFKRLRKVYDQLLNFEGDPNVFSNGNGSSKKETVDGTPLSELGLGLGPKVNGMDCRYCNHKGYIEKEPEWFIDCSACGGSGEVRRKTECRNCKGSGKFTQARSKRVVDCRTCRGTGSFLLSSMTICLECVGNGRVMEKTGSPLYHRCSSCYGTGEIRIYNPVIPKGRL